MQKKKGDKAKSAAAAAAALKKKISGPPPAPPSPALPPVVADQEADQFVAFRIESQADVPLAELEPASTPSSSCGGAAAAGAGATPGLNEQHCHFEFKIDFDQALDPAADEDLDEDLDEDEEDDLEEDTDEDDDDEDLEDEEEDDDLEEEEEEEEEDDEEDLEDHSRLDLDEEDSEASGVSEENAGSSLPHPGPRRHQYLLDCLQEDSGGDTPHRGRPPHSAESPHHPVDPETQSRLEALLEAAGIGSIEESNPNLADPEVLKRLTSSVSSALDEAAAALTRMRSDPPAEGRTLVEACTEGDIKKVQKLLHEGRVSVNDTTEEGESLLSLACSAGYFELAQVLIAMRANIEDRGMKGDCTPLMEAASAGHLDIVKLLINHGANVNAQSQSGNTPLMHACAGGHEAVVKALLDAGANVEDHNENGHTPLMEAASAGHVKVARILLSFGAGINTHSNEFKESALTLACYKGHLEMVRFLLDAGADQEHKTDEMHTALMEASMDGHVEVAKLLLDHGAQVNMPADSFESPLTLAACGGHVDLAMLLLERGANIEEVNDEGYTPLMEASREGHEEMVALLLSQGADINAQTDETQETALTLACCGGFLEVADFLYKAGADIELGASTPLMEASQEGHLDLVRYLLKMGAFVNAVTTTGDTALTYACENGHTDVAELLLMANAELEHESEGGRTPLMKAARSGHLSTVEFLLEKGADVNRATSNNDHTPLSLACGSGHQGVVDVLLQNGADPYHKLKDNSTMLIEAAKGGHTTVVQLLIDYPNTYPVVDPASSTSSSTLIDRVTGLPIASAGATTATNTTTTTTDDQCSTSAATSPSTLLCAAENNGSASAGPHHQHHHNHHQHPPTVSLPVKSVLRKNQRGAPSNFVPGTPNKEASSGGKVAKTNHANNASSSSLLHADSSGYDYFENSKFVLEGLADKGLDAKSYIQSMLNRTENATKEEQIQEKEQIVLELKRVERELQEKAEAQQKLLRESGEGSSNPPKAVTASGDPSKRMLTSKEILQYIANRTIDGKALPPGPVGVSIVSAPSPTTSNAAAAVVPLASSPPSGASAASTASAASAASVVSAGSGDGPAMLSQRALANMPPSERPKAKPSRKIEKGGGSGAAAAAAAKKSPCGALPLESPAGSGGVVGSVVAGSATTSTSPPTPAACGPSSTTLPAPTPVTSSSSSSSTSSSQQLQAALQQHSQQLAQLQQLQQLNQQLQQQVHQQRQLKQQNQATLAALQQNAIANQQQLAALQQNVAQLQQLEQHILSQQQQQQEQQQQQQLANNTSGAASASSSASSPSVTAPSSASSPASNSAAPPTTSAAETASSTSTSAPSSSSSSSSTSATSLSATASSSTPTTTTTTTPTASSSSNSTTTTTTNTPTTANNANQHHQLQQRVQQILQQKQQLQQQIKQFQLQVEQQLAYTQHTTSNAAAAGTSSSGSTSASTGPSSNNGNNAKNKRNKDGAKSSPAGSHEDAAAAAAAAAYEYVQAPQANQAVQALYQLEGPKGMVVPPSAEIEPLTQDPALLSSLDTSRIESQIAGLKNINISLDNRDNPALLDYKDGLHAAVLQYSSMALGGPGALMTPDEANASFGNQLLLQPPQFPFGQGADMNFLSDGSNYFGHPQDTIYLSGEQPDLPQCGLDPSQHLQHQQQHQQQEQQLQQLQQLQVDKQVGATSSKKARNIKSKKGTNNGLVAPVDHLGVIAPGASHPPPTATDPATSTDPNVSSGGELFAGGLDNQICQLSGQAGPTPLVDLDSETDSNHDTALTLACAGGHEELVTLLLDRGANIEHRDKKGFTPLILAATAGHEKVVEILLEHSADIEAQSERTKDTPLSLACSGGRYEVVDILLSRNANKEHRNVSDYTPLSLAASGGYVNIIKLLLSHGAEINSRTGSKLGISPLMLAAMNGHTAAVKLLLDMGSDINAQIETNRNTALTLACFQGRHEVVSLLLDRKANVEHRAKTGLTPLMEAASGGYVEVGRVLLDKGADANAPPVPSSRDTALTIAADKGHYRFVELLLGHAAQVDVRNKKGNSSLWLACNGGHLEVVQLLYSAAADIDSQDNRKVSCLMAAFRKGHQKVVKWMVKQVNQFPSDQELTRYIATISVSDKDLLKKTEQCKEIIRVAKERQAAEAAKNASILLEELDRESKLEQSKREAAARKREKKKRKKAEKMVKNTANDKENADDEEAGSKNGDDEEDKENSGSSGSAADVLKAGAQDDERDGTPDHVISALSHNEGGDSGIDANSQGSAASHESSKKDELSHAATESNNHAHIISTGGTTSNSNNKKKKNKKNKNKEKEKNERNQEERGCSPAAPPPLQTVREEPSKTAMSTAVVVPMEERKESLEMSRVPKTPDGHSVSISGVPPHEQEAKGRGGKASSLSGASHAGNTNPAASSSFTRSSRYQLVEKSLANLSLVSGASAKKAPTTRSSPPGGGMEHKTPHGNSHSSSSSVVVVGEKQHGQAHQHPDAASTGWKEVVRKSKKVSVPSNAISRVIGRGGCNINAIRELSGAHIEVEKQSSKGGGVVDRTILIKGSADATRQANTWIQEIINNPEKDMADIIGKPFKQLQQQQQQQQVQQQQQTLVVTNKQQQQPPQPLMSKPPAMGQMGMASKAPSQPPSSMLTGGLAKSSPGSSKSPQMTATLAKGEVQRSAQPSIIAQPPVPKAPFPGTPVPAGKPGKPSSFAAVAGGSEGGSPVGMIATGAHPGSHRPMGSFGSSPLPAKRDREDPPVAPASSSTLKMPPPLGAKMDSFLGFSTSVGMTPTATVGPSLASNLMTNNHNHATSLNSKEYSPFKYKMEWNTNPTPSASSSALAAQRDSLESSAFGPSETGLRYPSSGPPVPPSSVDMSKAPGFNRASLGSPGPGVLAAGGAGASWLSKSPGSSSEPADALYQTQERCNSAPGTPMSPNVPAPIGPPASAAASSSGGSGGSKSTLSPGSEPDYFRPQITPISSAPGAPLGRHRFSPVGPGLAGGGAGGAGVTNHYGSGRAMTPDSELDHIRGGPSMAQNRPSSVAGMDKKDFYSASSVPRYGGTPKPGNTLEGIMKLASQLSNVPGFQDLISNGSPTSETPAGPFDYMARSRFNNPSMALMNTQPPQPPQQQQHGGPKLNPHAPDFMRPPGDSFKMGSHVMSGPPPMRNTLPPGGSGMGLKSHGGFYGSAVTTSSAGMYPSHNPNMNAAMSALSGHSISAINQSLQQSSNHDFSYDLSNLGGRSLKEINDMLAGTGDFNSSIPPPSGPPPYMNSPPVGMMDSDTSRFSRPIGAERRAPLGSSGGPAQHQQPPPPLKMSNWDLYGSSDLTNGGGTGGMATIPSSLTGHTLDSLLKGASSFHCSQAGGGGGGGGMMSDYALMGSSGLQSPATSIGMSPNVTPTKNPEFGAYALSGAQGSAGKKINLPGVGYGDPTSGAKRNESEYWSSKWQE